MKTILPLFPDNTIYIELFEDVENASYILQQLKSANNSYDFCFLDCRRICATDQVLCATMRALRDQRDGVMRTRTLYSEIVYSMSPNQNITEALKYFGIADDCRALLYLSIDKEIDDSLVQGQKSNDITASLQQLCNYDQLKKVYKLDKGLDDTEEMKKQVMTAIAMRGNL